MGKKRKGGGDAKRFREYADEYLDDFLDQEFRDSKEDEEEEAPPPLVNELYIQSFVDEWQPEYDERQPYVRAFSMGELREVMHIYRTFDTKSPDPFPHYMAALSSHGFSLKMGCSGEMVVLASRRNHSDKLITPA